MERGPHDTLTEAEIKLLRDRARELAATEERQAAHSAAPLTEASAHLVVRLFDARYALPQETVREVIRVRSMVAVPNVPPHVVGVTRVRGRVMALVDLRRFWVQDLKGHADSDEAVVVSVDGIECGLVCSAVEGLVAVSPDELTPPPAPLPANLAASLRGVAQRDLLVIDPKALFAQPGFRLDHEGGTR